MTCPTCGKLMILRVLPIRGGEDNDQHRADHWCAKCRTSTGAHWSDRAVTYHDSARWEEANGGGE